MGNGMYNDEQLAHAEIVQKETEDALTWWKSRVRAAEARAAKAISDTVQEFTRRRAAEARVAELEAALREIAGTQSNCGFCWDARRIARRALAADAPAGEEKNNG